MMVGCAVSAGPAPSPLSLPEYLVGLEGNKFSDTEFHSHTGAHETIV